MNKYKYVVYVGGEKRFGVSSKKKLLEVLKREFTECGVTTRQIRALKPGQVKMLGVVTTCEPEYKLRGYENGTYKLPPPSFYTGYVAYGRQRFPIFVYDLCSLDTPHLFPPRVVNSLWQRKHALTVIVGA